jgi:hypothetical protein
MPYEAVALRTLESASSGSSLNASQALTAGDCGGVPEGAKMALSRHRLEMACLGDPEWMTGHPVVASLDGHFICGEPVGVAAPRGRLPLPRAATPAFRYMPAVSRCTS